MRSLCALSVPHPRAIAAAMKRSSQALRSWYVAMFQLPAIPEATLGSRDGRLFEASLVRSGLDRATARRYAARSTEPGGITGPIGWYRALPLAGQRTGAVTVPTLYVWGDRERYVSRRAAEGCAAWVTGPYRFVVLPGRTHWLPTTAAGEVAQLVLDHLVAN
ncbi:MAG: hypothetical protein ACRDYY_14535 [Acidimicrobiales bacterium]